MDSKVSDPLKYPLATAANLRIAETYLSDVDPIIGSLIKSYGKCQLSPHDDYYGELVSSIISQQLSVKAADSITRHFTSLFGGKLPSPKAILAKPAEELRTVGLSYSKVGYIKDLASKVEDKTLELDKISKLSNQQIIEELTSVKGIGVWTSHMFLIFCVGRLDILPSGDLGIKKGIKNLYKLKSLPDESEIESICKMQRWQPYASVASWYIWQALDNN